jgi:hypothetical protein
VLTVVLSLVGYVALTIALWFFLNDPWTRVGTALTVIGTALTVLTLALVAFIKRDLLAKGTLPPLLKRMRAINSDLAALLPTVSANPEDVRHTLSLMSGVLLSMDRKVSGEHQTLIRDARKKIDMAQRRKTFWGSPIALSEPRVREIYVALVYIEEAVKHYISDLQRS